MKKDIFKRAGLLAASHCGLLRCCFRRLIAERTAVCPSDSGKLDTSGVYAACCSD